MNDTEIVADVFRENKSCLLNHSDVHSKTFLRTVYVVVNRIFAYCSQSNKWPEHRVGRARVGAVMKSRVVAEECCRVQRAADDSLTWRHCNVSYDHRSLSNRLWHKRMHTYMYMSDTSGDTTTTWMGRPAEYHALLQGRRHPITPRTLILWTVLNWKLNKIT